MSFVEQKRNNLFFGCIVNNQKYIFKILKNIFARKKYDISLLSYI